MYGEYKVKLTSSVYSLQVQSIIAEPDYTQRHTHTHSVGLLWTKDNDLPSSIITVNYLYYIILLYKYSYIIILLLLLLLNCTYSNGLSLKARNFLKEREAFCYRRKELLRREILTTSKKTKYSIRQVIRANSSFQYPYVRGMWQ